MAATERVYLGRDNEIRLALYNNDVLWPPEMVAAITKAEVVFEGAFYDSETYPDAFNLSDYADAGAIGLTLGHVIPAKGKDTRVELIIYTLDHPNGFVQGVFTLIADDTASPA